MLTLLIAATTLLDPIGPNNVIPRPSEVRMPYGVPVELDIKNLKICGGSKSENVVRLFAEMIRKDGGRVKIVKLGQKSDITFLLDPGRVRQHLGKEGYLLDTGQGLRVTAYEEPGLFYGAQTVRQLLEPKKDGKAALWNLNIVDKPRFPWRGMHLDCSRHFFTVPEIKDYIDQLARYKMNVFHWHLTDEGGWRMESKKYPKLTSIGAWRSDLGTEIWNYGKLEFSGPGTGKKLYGGFYTQAQIKDVVKFAQERMVTIVPEIELPGHCLPALVAYPEVSCDVTKDPARPYRTTAYCAGKEQTFTFLQDILDETMALFPSKTIHIGGDEVDQFFWSHCSDCQARMIKEKLKNTGELQSYFVKRVEKYLNSKGRTLMGWDEILEGGLAPNAQVMSWRGMDGGIAAAKAGHPVVMTPTSHCYFDFSYDGTSTKNVYGFEPVPAGFTFDQTKLVLGAQGNVWTEWMPNYAKVQQMIFPRMLAMSEVLWSPKDARNYDDFERRLTPAYARFVREGTNFYSEAPTADYGLIVMGDSCEVSFKMPPIPGLSMRYTTDGSTPTLKSQLYTGPVKVSKPCTVKARTFMGTTDLNQPVEVLCRNPLAAQPKGTGVNFKMVAQGFDKIPDFSKLTATEEGNCTDLSIDKWHSLPVFAVEFKGYLKAETAGSYEFHLTSDDGSALWIDDALVVNHDGPHGASEKSGKAWLMPGSYAFTLRYFESGGAESLKATVGTPGGVVPLESLLVRSR
ncbi:MAG: family 20 glycosylhydrolase [Armatimonadetes bacterium]|nr:family 20 glycosylhydrolase [Armatimonadota bacterium]